MAHRITVTLLAVLLTSAMALQMPAGVTLHASSAVRALSVKAQFDSRPEHELYSRQELEQLLTQLESLRDWVSRDVAAAAMQAAREKRSLDDFISALQDEVSGLGDTIRKDLDAGEKELAEQSDVYAFEKRGLMLARAETLLTELEEKAPPSLKAWRAGGEQVEKAQKSPFLRRGATVVTLGANSAFGEVLTAGLERAGYTLRDGPLRCPPGCADPTLPASSSLRSSLEGADALVIVSSGAAGGRGGVSSTVIRAAARVLPPTLRRVLVISPRGVERTFELGFALRNALGQLDAQRAAEQAIMAAAKGVGAVTTVLRTSITQDTAGGGSGGGGGNIGSRNSGSGGGRTSGSVSGGFSGGISGSGGGGAPWSLSALETVGGFRLAPGDALDGVVGVVVAARAAREALRRTEAEDTCFSLATGDGDSWQDEFLRLVGPEIGYAIHRLLPCAATHGRAIPNAHTALRAHLRHAWSPLGLSGAASLVRPLWCTGLCS